MQNFKKINPVKFLHGARKIFFVGIGGIGVSALAKLFKSQGKKVIGSDKYSSEITDDLKKQGIKVYIGHQKKNLDSDTDLVIYSPAVKQEIPERKKALKLGIKQLSYPEALGLITRDKYTIAVSGTHGKSTITAILGLILTEAGFDPTVIIGSKVGLFNNSNLRIGKSNYFVVEACEWRAHMLNLKPRVVILTNIERDHLDYYKNLGNIKKAFKEYVGRLFENDLLIFNADDEVCFKIAESPKCRKVSYGIKNKKADCRAINIKIEDQIQAFELIYQRKNFGKFTLQIPGQFNIYNALAASACTLKLGVKSQIIKKVLADFKGIWRRFEVINADKRGYTRLPAGRQGFTPKITLISDYAHHPTAIKETIKAAKEFYPDRRLVVVYQPHHFDRTRRLFKEFTKAFDQADLIILNEIYDVPGRESTKDISSRDLVKKLKKRGLAAFYTKNLVETKRLLLKNIKINDLVLVAGAGDIYKLKVKS